MDYQCRFSISSIIILLLFCVIGFPSCWAQSLGLNEVYSSHSIKEKADGYTAIYQFDSDLNYLLNNGSLVLSYIYLPRLSMTITCLEQINLNHLDAFYENPVIDGWLDQNPFDIVTRLCNNYIPDLKKCKKGDDFHSSILKNSLKLCRKDCWNKCRTIIRLKGTELNKCFNECADDGFCFGGKESIEHVCPNGDRMNKYVHYKGLDCRKGDIREDILRCLERKEPLLVHQQQDYAILHPANCRILAESNNCVVKVFEKCTNTSLVRDYLGRVNMKTDCSRSSPLSPISSNDREDL